MTRFMKMTFEKKISKYEQVFELFPASQVSWVKSLTKKEAYAAAEKAGYYWHSSSSRWVGVSYITLLFPKKLRFFSPKRIGQEKQPDRAAVIVNGGRGIPGTGREI